MTWQVKFLKQQCGNSRSLGNKPQRDILKYLKKRIETAEDPQRYGDPLRRSLSGLWKYRVGDYRLICEVRQEKIVVLVLALGIDGKFTVVISSGRALVRNILTTPQAFSLRLAIESYNKEQLHNIPSVPSGSSGFPPPRE